jgi:hypothetical protein
VLHLFGHALGFSHEGLLAGEKDVAVGACGPSDTARSASGYWERSIMSRNGYCGIANLTPYDVALLRSVYGRKGSGALVSSSGRCLDIPNEAAQQWQTLQIYECTFWRNQSWYRDDDGHFFVAYAPGLAIDVALGAPTRYLQLYSRSQPITFNQKFELADGQLRAVGDSCLNGSADGAVVAGPCDLLGQRGWQIGSDGTIEFDGGCLTAGMLADGDASASISACTRAPSQAFVFSRTGQLRHGQLCLEVVPSGDVDASRATRLATCLDETDPSLPNQQFYFRGSVQNGGQCLHVTGQTAVENAGLEMVDCAQNDQSQWWDYYFTDPP